MASSKRASDILATRHLSTVTAGPANMPDMAAKRGKDSIPEEACKNVRRLMGQLLRDRFGDNYAEFGRAIGTSGQAISQILSGENRPGWGTVGGLRTYLGVTWDDILAGRADAAVGPPSNVGDASLPAPPEGTVEHMATMLSMRDLPRARYPQLEYAIAYHADEKSRWSPVTILAARQGQFESAGCDAWTPPQWSDALDRLEKVVRHVAMAPGMAPFQPPSPAPPSVRAKKS